MKFVSDFSRKRDVCGNRYLYIYLQRCGAGGGIIPFLSLNQIQMRRISGSPHLLFFLDILFRNVVFHNLNIKPFFLFLKKLELYSSWCERRFSIIIFINLLLGQEDPLVYSKNTNILSKGHVGSFENTVLSKLKEVDTQFKSLQQNYNYYMNLTERMIKRMEEIKHNMSYLLERHFQPVQQFEGKIFNQLDDKPG